MCGVPSVPHCPGRACAACYTRRKYTVPAAVDQSVLCPAGTVFCEYHCHRDPPDAVVREHSTCIACNRLIHGSRGELSRPSVPPLDRVRFEFGLKDNLLSTSQEDRYVFAILLARYKQCVFNAELKNKNRGGSSAAGPVSWQ